MRAGVLLGVLLWIACATPYQSKGWWRGGYEDTNLGNGKWMIDVEVNRHTSRNTAVQYTYRRAAEICPAGFDVVDADRNTNDESSAVLVVQCRPGQVQSEPPGLVRPE